MKDGNIFLAQLWQTILKESDYPLNVALQRAIEHEVASVRVVRGSNYKSYKEDGNIWIWGE